MKEKEIVQSDNGFGFRSTQKFLLPLHPHGQEHLQHGFLIRNFSVHWLPILRLIHAKSCKDHDDLFKTVEYHFNNIMVQNPFLICAANRSLFGTCASVWSSCSGGTGGERGTLIALHSRTSFRFHRACFHQIHSPNRKLVNLL